MMSESKWIVRAPITLVVECPDDQQPDLAIERALAEVRRVSRATGGNLQPSYDFSGSAEVYEYEGDT